MYITNTDIQDSHNIWLYMDLYNNIHIQDMNWKHIKYTNKLPRMDTNIIVKARTRMVKV